MLHFGGRRRTPIVEQSEAGECGLACLAMVAGFHGQAIDLPTLRERFGTSLKGTTLKQLMAIAEALGFNARPVRAELDDLPQLTLPAVLHWDLTHYVVLTRVSTGARQTRYRVHDPARGRATVSREEMSRCFTGVALDLLPSESFRPKADLTTLRLSHLWSSMVGFWETLGTLILLSLAMQVVAVAAPFFLQLAIDNVLPSSDRDLLTILALGFGGLAVIGLLTAWQRALVLVSLNSTLSYQIVVNLFRHLLNLPLPWFEKRHVGDIISRFGSTRSVTQVLSQGLIASAMDGVLAIATLALMFVYSPLLSAISLGALGLYLVVRFAFMSTLRLRNISVITTAARENSAFIESVRGIGAIKAFGQESNRRRLWQRTRAEAANAEIAMGRLSAGFDATAQFILAGERVLFVFVAVRLALDGGFTIGMVFAFQAYKQQFLDASMRLVEQTINYRLMGMHLSRISDIALSRAETTDDRLSLDAPDFSQPIEVANIWFAYAQGEPAVLRDVKLWVPPGKMMALVGPSGGGKTTLLKILMGLFEPTHGRILIGGRPMAAFAKSGLRARIGSVAQDDSLYAGSLAQNIAFFDPEIDMGRVEEVARLAMIHDDIRAMPMAYDTMVGDMGSVLSGGQKQRVLLARALYGRPEILFIDEGTSNLDGKMEEALVEMISKLPITRVVSTHSKVLAARADRVLRVQDGTVATAEVVTTLSGAR
jgi:ATP-binding cassette subfamily B protein RaxB